MATITDEELQLLRAKSEGFDRLIHDLAHLLPPDAAIKKLAGLPLLEALKDYELTVTLKPKSLKSLRDMTLNELYDLEEKYTATIGHH